MNKQALVASLATGTGTSKAQAERMLDSVLVAVKAGLKTNGEVILSGIGKLKVVERKARSGRNPNTGKEIKIPAKRVVKFKASSVFSPA